MGKRVIMFNWDYWDAQLEGYKNIPLCQRRIWRDHKNEHKTIIDEIYEWYWGDEQ
tara:strand:+ start:68 stop:232 length:165 start_codon:yes stop_codon:yes gene_type:complete